jgi:hypothetical protein
MGKALPNRYDEMLTRYENVVILFFKKVLQKRENLFLREKRQDPRRGFPYPKVDK